MNPPKLPRQYSPEIPRSMRKGLEQQEPPKSNFFFILVMTFLVMFSCQMMTRDREPQPIPFDASNELANAAAPTLDENQIKALPQEIVQEAKSAADEVAPIFVSLGSLDPDSPYRMLVSLTNRGAAVARVELNESAYCDNSDETGYLGQIVVDEKYAAEEFNIGLPGVGVQTVGQGTPAAAAGLQPGDRIVGLVNAKGEETKIEKFDDLRTALLATKPGDVVHLRAYRATALETKPNCLAARRFINERIVSDTEKTSRAEVKTTEPATAATQDATAKDPDENQEEVAASTEPTSETPVSDDAEKEKIANFVDAIADKPIELKSLDQELAELGEPETLEATLGVAPLAVLSPNGMVLDYADYVNLRGLQGLNYLGSIGDAQALADYEASRGKGANVRKNNNDPASFLTSLAAVDNDTLTRWSPQNDAATASTNAPRASEIDAELPGVNLRDGYWTFVAEESNERCAVFKKILLERRLEVVKKYELARDGDERSEGAADAFVKNNRAYHLKLSFSIRNVDPSTSRKVAYLQDGPNGLPLEGAWFASGRKTGPGFGTAYGMRDLTASVDDNRNFSIIGCSNIAQGKTKPSDVQTIDFIGVDGQYFQCTAVPAKGDGAAPRFAFAPIRVGARFRPHLNFTNVSFRLRSDDLTLAPYGTQGDSVSQEFVVFAGPKKRDVMADYGLKRTLYYGWFWFVSIPLLWILHFFHDFVVFNYGLAIILLTILVRVCLFPLSRKQVASSIKMQQLQPEIAKLKERYKDKPQEMMVAQQALFKKYGVNPLSGCLPVLIQMPIFIGLYKALSLDVNLYGASLFSKSVRWCSNLAAPDMAFNWSEFWNSIGLPSFNMSQGGIFSIFMLGPYLNVLPIITIVLFLVQQKLMVPPPVGDDLQAQQQRSMRKMMNFMMIFMGLMFFKVPSGLCLYFIVSSLWGLFERKILPRRDATLATEPSAIPVVETPSAIGTDRARTPRGRAPREIVQKPKSKLRKWWDEVLERAAEQQRLVKAEIENGEHKKRGKKNKRR